MRKQITVFASDFNVSDSSGSRTASELHKSGDYSKESSKDKRRKSKHQHTETGACNSTPNPNKLSQTSNSCRDGHVVARRGGRDVTRSRQGESQWKSVSGNASDAIHRPARHNGTDVGFAHDGKLRSGESRESAGRKGAERGRGGCHTTAVYLSGDKREIPSPPAFLNERHEDSEENETEGIRPHLRRQTIPWGFSMPPPKPPRSSQVPMTSFAYGTEKNIN